jgi:hypothetical protein
VQRLRRLRIAEDPPVQVTSLSVCRALANSVTWMVLASPSLHPSSSPVSIFLIDRRSEATKEECFQSVIPVAITPVELNCFAVAP